MNKILKILAFTLFTIIAGTSYAQSTVGLILSDNDQEIQLSVRANKIDVTADGYFVGNIESNDDITLVLENDRSETLNVGQLVPGEIYKYRVGGITVFLMKETIGVATAESFMKLKKVWCCTNHTKKSHCDKEKLVLMDAPTPHAERNVKQIIVQGN